jgi:hypothetical protein
MVLGVYDGDFQMSHALALVRRYVDRNAQFDKGKTGIIYHQFRNRREWNPAYWGDGSAIRTKRGNQIESPQYVKDYCFMSRADALQMVYDLSKD